MRERLRLRLVGLRQRLVRIGNSIPFLPLALLLATITLFVLSSLLDGRGLSATMSARKWRSSFERPSTGSGPGWSHPPPAG